MSPDRSRPASRASMTRGPSMARGYDSRSNSRDSSAEVGSRCASPTPSYYTANVTSASRATTPGMGYPPLPKSAHNRGRHASSSSNNTASEYITASRSLRSRSPSPSYTDILCTASRKLRERSIPPPPPLPSKIEVVRPPTPPGKPPPGPPRVVASDFYKGKVKSIYEREPLFKDFCHIIPHRYGSINIYNAQTLDTLKYDFKAMVEDKMTRRSLEDPSVESNILAKAYAWRDLVVKPKEPASARIFREQSSRPRLTSPSPTPKLYVYHRSTFNNPAETNHF